MWFDESVKLWRYEDDDSLVRDNWRSRPCGHCGERFNEGGHDPCIANLPNAVNACCGHGEPREAYVVFEDGTELRGDDAIAFFGRVDI